MFSKALGCYCSDILVVALFVWGLVRILCDRPRIDARADRCFALTAFGFYLFNFCEKLAAEGWGGRNVGLVLPTGNFSPFLFCLLALSLVFPEKIKRIVYTALALLSPALFFAALYNSLYFTVSIYTRGYPYALFITADCLAHVLVALWGAALVVSGRVDLRGGTLVGALCFIAGVPAVMAVCNALCGTAFFGLAWDGRHNIYNNVLTSGPVLNLLLYYAGLAAVTALGWALMRLIRKKTAPAD